jgi:predicted MFS family arabinose efflux permease
MLGEVFGDATLRETAYALDSVAQEIIWISGPLVVAVVVAVASPPVALLLTGGVSLLGTMLFVRAPLVRHAPRPQRGADRGAALASPALRTLLVPVALTGMALGATEVGLPALALHAGSRSSAGVLLALWSVGSMTGGLWYGARSWQTPLVVRYGMLLVGAVACTAPLIVARSLLAGVVFSLLAGLTIAPVFSCQYALVGRTVTAGAETEAFTWVSAALIAGVAGGSALGGAVVSSIGFNAPFELACAATVLAAGMAFLAWAAGTLRVDSLA